MKEVLSNILTVILVIICIADISAEKSSSMHDMNMIGTSINIDAIPAIVDTTTEFSISLCSGESIEINGTTYNENNPSGVEVFVGANGCDSTVIIELEFAVSIEFQLSETLCAGDSIVVNGTTYNESNSSGTEIILAANTCDTIIIVELTYLETPITELNITACPDDSYIINSTTYDENNPTGMEIFVGASANGCDSVVMVNLSFIQITPAEVFETLCIGDSINIEGAIYDENNPFGSLILFGANENGCDSIIYVELSFVESSFTVNGLDMAANVSDADNYQWLLEGNPIEGATSNSWTALENGNYGLQIEVDGVSCTSDAAYVTVTAVYEITQDPRLKIYPNPIQDHIHIHLNEGLEGKIKRYELFNLEGQLIQKGIYQNSINIESIKSGIYLFRLFDESQNVYVQKLKI